MEECLLSIVLNMERARDSSSPLLEPLVMLDATGELYRQFLVLLLLSTALACTYATLLFYDLLRKTVQPTI